MSTYCVHVMLELSLLSPEKVLSLVSDKHKPQLFLLQVSPFLALVSYSADSQPAFFCSQEAQRKASESQKSRSWIKCPV